MPADRALDAIRPARPAPHTPTSRSRSHLVVVPQPTHCYGEEICQHSGVDAMRPARSAPYTPTSRSRSHLLAVPQPAHRYTSPTHALAHPAHSRPPCWTQCREEEEAAESQGTAPTRQTAVSTPCARPAPSAYCQHTAIPLPSAPPSVCQHPPHVHAIPALAYAAHSAPTHARKRIARAGRVRTLCMP
ncbi:hypothetical protein PLICRDRAFT_176526 [Plicaturopsis crispa FD-325 SS-3]|nr:hypothetical protein PLICRDRAFT_176526 [Plicaturopsis crispa FD-325 SS-3]